jgi:hypothetical protein
MPSPSLPFPIYAYRDSLHWVGDSLVEFFGNNPPGGIPAPLMWQIHGQQAANYYANNPYKGGSPPYDKTQSYLMPFTTNGKSGTGIVDLATNVQSRVIDPLNAGFVGRMGRPILVHEFSVNDGGNMNLGQWNADGGSTYFDAIEAGVHNVLILCLSIPFSNTEQWNVGAGTWNADTIDASNAFYQTYAASRGYYFYDWRGAHITDPNTALNLESTLNPTGAVSSGIVTYDGTHPIASAGETLMINCLLPNLDIHY